MQKLYIIKAGSTFPHIRAHHQDFEHWIAAGLIPPSLLVAERPVLSVIDAVNNTHGPLAYPSPNTCAGVVISGSHAMVSEQTDWMQDLQQWLYDVCMAGVPVLGICFGHQILAQTLGGHVAEHPSGLELGTVPISIQTDVSQDPLWRHMPPCFEAHTVHYQSVRSLPADACLIAGNSHEAHHAFRWRYNVWGVQFHPEFHHSVMQDYINHIAPKPKAVRCNETSDAAQLLHAFTLHVQQLSRYPQAWRHAA